MRVLYKPINRYPHRHLYDAYIGERGYVYQHSKRRELSGGAAAETGRSGSALVYCILLYCILVYRCVFLQHLATSFIRRTMLISMALFSYMY